MRHPSEREVETLILDYLTHLPGCFAWKNPSAGYFDARIGRFRKHVSKYSINGVADILGIYQGRPLAIEVKSKTGKLSVDQEVFLRLFSLNGGLAGVCRSLEDVQQLLKASVV